MPCYHPLTAYRSRAGRNPKTGSWPIVFKIREGYHDLPVTVPCGQCIGCRLEHSRQWAIRCVLEAQQNSENCFITLTYDDAHLPPNNSLDKRTMQLFIKKLRKKYKNKKIKYYLCGEYGELNTRPHYHICMFGHDFPDKTLWSVRDGVQLYLSDTLSQLWPNGYATVGEVTFESAAYVARYCLKKRKGGQGGEPLGSPPCQAETLIPEFSLMSRNPGIGRRWFDLYQNDILSTDKIIVRNNLKIKPPKYYDSIVKSSNPKLMEAIKWKRKSAIDPAEQTYERLRTKEEIATIKKNLLKRGYEKWQSKKFTQSVTQKSRITAHL